MRSSFVTPVRLCLISLVVLLCAAHVWLSNRAMMEKSTTSDEIAHVTGGYTFNYWDDYRLQPENGNLPQRWQTLPILMSGVRYPSQTDGWKKSDVWLMGYRFFYQSGNDSAKMLASARLMNSFFGAGVALLVFFWSRRLWGTAGGLISLVFCALCPTMLAHSALATSDMCMAFFLLASVSAFWCHLHDNRLLNLMVSAVVFGLACVAKFTAVLLPILAVILVLIRLWEPEPLRFRQRNFTTMSAKLAAIVSSLAIHGIAGALIIWLFFGFRYTAFNPKLPAGNFIFPWEMMLSFGGWKAHLIEFCRTWRILPEGFLYGLAFVLKHAEARGAFLDGEYSIYGWASFFPKAFLYKTPLSLLTALGISLGLFAMKARKVAGTRLLRHLCPAAPLAALFVLYWAISLASHLNIGQRHLLPIYPVLYIFCGALGWAARAAFKHSRSSGTVIALMIAVLLGWHVKVAAGIYPDFLAYFSPVVGGPAEGYKHLVDSSLDWGQDLPGLKKWLDANRHAGEPLYISYFGTGEPDYYGIKGTRISMLPDFDQTNPIWYSFEPGIYAISATMLQQVYSKHQGTWSAEIEREYQQLRRNDDVFKTLPRFPRTQTDLVQGIPLNQWSTAWKLYAQLRFARLCYYLRARPPDAMVGYSILIFRLSSKEIRSAVDGTATELRVATKQAAAGSRSP